MEEMTLVVQAREECGKNKNRRLRAGGVVPAVVYGAGRKTVPIQVEKKTVLDLLRGDGAGMNSIFLLELEGTGKSRHAMIRDMQVDPLSRKILHIDFQRVLLDQVVHVAVPVELVGLAEGVKNEGGLIDFITRELEVECLPTKIPDVLEIDVTELHVGDHISAGDIALPEGVILKLDPQRVIASLVAQKAEEVEEEEDMDLLEAPTAEPEVIGRDADGEESEG